MDHGLKFAGRAQIFSTFNLLGVKYEAKVKVIKIRNIPLNWDPNMQKDEESKYE